MKKHLSPFIRAGLSALLLMGVSAGAHAAPALQIANINVTPLRLDLPSDREATQMMIRNHADSEVALQLRVYEWVQVDGKDNYRPSRDLVVSPSIVEIDPGRTQTFHVVSVARRAADTESRYRVVIDELPGQAGSAPGTAQTRLRLTLPAFVNSDRTSPGAIEVTVRPDSLVLANPGGRTVRLADLALSADGAPVDLGEKAMLVYVHGSNWIALPLPAGLACSADRIAFKAQSDTGTIDVVARQACP